MPRELSTDTLEMFLVLFLSLHIVRMLAPKFLIVDITNKMYDAATAGVSSKPAQIDQPSNTISAVSVHTARRSDPASVGRINASRSTLLGRDAVGVYTLHLFRKKSRYRVN